MLYFYPVNWCCNYITTTGVTGGTGTAFHSGAPSVFSGVHLTRSVVLYAFCLSLFVLLYLFFWPLYSLYFFDIRILITPLFSSNYSCHICVAELCYAFDFHCFLFVFRSCKFDLRSILLLSTVLNVKRHYLPTCAIYGSVLC